MGGLLNTQLIKYYTYTLSANEERNVTCTQGFVVIRVESNITGTLASFYHITNGSVINFYTTLDAAISNTSDTAILKVTSGESPNTVKLKNKRSDNLTVFMRVI